MRLSHARLTLAVLLLFHTPAPQAFSSFDFQGGAYHKQITHAALEPLGVSAESLGWIDLGDLEPDKFYSPLFSFKPLHFTDMTFDQSRRELERRFREVVLTCDQAVVDYQAYRQALLQFGTYLHPVQDFYSHTNWLELHLAGGESDVPLAPMDFHIEVANLVSPYTLAHTLPPEEVEDSAEFETVFDGRFTTPRSWML